MMTLLQEQEIMCQQHTLSDSKLSTASGLPRVKIHAVINQVMQAVASADLHP